MMAKPHDMNKLSGGRDRAALVVTGMHRSGTSAMARVLSLAGAALPERIMQPGPDNPLGFWEPWEMVALNDQMLAAVGSRWDNVFGHRDGAAVWALRKDFRDAAAGFLRQNVAYRDLPVLKDPRTSLTARFWNDALQSEGLRPVHIIMIRHPLEVARSIAARDGSSETKSLLVWTSYMLAIERDTRDVARVFVTYEQLLQSPQSALDRVETVIGRSLPDRSPERLKDIVAFLSDSHRHHHVDPTDLKNRTDIWPGVIVTYRWMCAAAEGRPRAVEELQAVEADLDALEVAVGPALADLRRDLAVFPTVRAERDEALKENATLQTLCNDFHAQADHNGQFLEAARDQIVHLSKELDIARAEAARARSDNETLLSARQELAQAEIRILQQQTRNQALMEALDMAHRELTAKTFTVTLSNECTQALIECKAALEEARSEARTHKLESAEARTAAGRVGEEADEARAAATRYREEMIEARTLLETVSSQAHAQATRAAADRQALESQIRQLTDVLAQREVSLSECRANVIAAERDLAQALKDNERHEIVLTQIRASLSWRMTRPIRVLQKRFGS